MRTILIISVVMLSTIGCSDYLTKHPISSYSSGGFYKKSIDFELALNGLYSNLREISYNSNIVLESRSDNTKARQIGSENQPFAIVSSFTETPATSGNLLDLWRSYWSVIYQSNSIINNIGNADFDDLNLKSYFNGEALFFRGYAYFQLVKLWGGMPIIEDEISQSKLAGIERKSEDETIKFAEQSLIEAIDLLPESWQEKYRGKINKYGAKGFLARLYLYKHEFEKASSELKNIIETGLYDLAGSYDNIFSESFDNSSEHLFQVQFIGGGNGQGMFLPYYYFGKYKHKYFPTGSSPGIFISEDLYNSFEEGDIRRDYSIAKNLYDLNDNLNTSSMFSIKFAHGLNESNFRDYGLNYSLLRYTDVLLMYAETINEIGNGSLDEIQIILNRIRDRAGLPSIDISNLSKQSIREIIFKERRHEFAFEGLRWFDLQRAGIAIDVMNEFLSTPEEGNGVFKMNEYQSIFPIPQREINISSGNDYMYQNPGF